MARRNSVEAVAASEGMRSRLSTSARFSGAFAGVAALRSAFGVSALLSAFGAASIGGVSRASASLSVSATAVGALAGGATGAAAGAAGTACSTALTVRGGALTRPAEPPRARRGCRGIVYRGAHVTLLDLVAALAVHEKQRLVGEDIDQARNAAARDVDGLQGAFGKEGRMRAARNRQTMRHVSRELFARQRFQGVLKDDALAQLAHRVLGELAVELGLPEEHHLHELAPLGLQV